MSGPGAGPAVRADPGALSQSGGVPSAGRTAAYIDLDALSENLAAVRGRLGPGRETLAVVKAEAYGHGAPEAAEAFLRGGARLLGVATVEEAAALRAFSKEGPLARASILVMSGAAPAEAPRIAAFDLEAAVWDIAQVEALSAAARAAGRRLRLHLKVDSGMGRLGAAPAEAADFLRAAAAMEGIEVAGLMSHLAQAEEEGGEAPTRAQFEVIRDLAGDLRAKGLLPPLLHCANSAGGLLFPDAPGEIVRAGIALYGCPPAAAEGVTLRPAMRWRSAVIQVREIAAGAPVGYGGAYRRSTPGRIAVVSAGYGDGYPRLLSNRGDALVGGRRVPVAGRVSMDMLTLDVSGLDEVRAGDEAVLLGAQGEERIRAEELADRAETIPYEILCGVGGRVPRVFVRDGREAGRRTLWSGAPRDPAPGEEGS
ncbi:MAG: alanine racemase [bacterium]